MQPFFVRGRQMANQRRRRMSFIMRLADVSSGGAVSSHLCDWFTVFRRLVLHEHRSE